MIKHRIQKLEERLQAKGRSIKIWDVKYENADNQIADIISGKVKNPDGSFYSGNDINYFFYFDMFMPKTKKGGNAKGQY